MTDTAGPRGARHLVLLGLPGSGKSTIGPLVAQQLRRQFVDLDAAIESEAGASVADLFSRHGEGPFRASERLLTARLLDGAHEPLVLAPGGGWVEDAENRAWLSRTADAVYLRVSPAVALARMGPAVAARPLLAGADSAAKLAELLMRREAFYLQARYAVSNDLMSPVDAASSIVALALAERRD